MKKYKNTYLVKDNLAILLITYKEKVIEVLIDKEDINRINKHIMLKIEKCIVLVIMIQKKKQRM